MHVIELNCDPEKLRTMYFQSGEDKWFFGPKTRKESIAILIMPLVLLLSIYLSRSQKREDLLFVGCMICVMLTYSFFRSFFRIRKWKRAVLKFIGESANSDIRFSYNDEGYTHTMNEHFLKREWKEVVASQIVDGEYITLSHEDAQTVVPACCIQPEEFTLLAETIREKVGNVNQKLA